MVKIPAAIDSYSVFYYEIFIVAVSISVHQIAMKVFSELDITVALFP